MDNRFLLWNEWKHWEKIADGFITDQQEQNSFLCYVYHDCDECPIYHETKQTDCTGTPYWDWVEAALDLSCGKWAVDRDAINAALEMKEWIVTLYKKLYDVHPAQDIY